MQTIKQSKLIELEQSKKGFLQILDRAYTLRDALKQYDKKTINKTFFEKYFTYKDEKGEIAEDWKGNIRTDFQFSSPAYSFDRYDKRIYLANSEYGDTSRIYI